MTKRTKEEVCMDVLECLLFNRLNLKYSQLIQKSNTNTNKLRKILPELIEEGLIRKGEIITNPMKKGKRIGYIITNEGIKKYIDYKVNYFQLKVRTIKKEAWGGLDENIK